MVFKVGIRHFAAISLIESLQEEQEDQSAPSRFGLVNGGKVANRYYHE